MSARDIGGVGKYNVNNTNWSIEMGEQEQRVEFETRIGAKELMDFKIYHNYHSVSGIASLLFGIIALVICIVSINRVNISYTLMMGFLDFFFTVYTPIGMKRKVNKQIKTVPAFAEACKICHNHLKR